MKRFLVTREESDHIIIEADSILNAYMRACAEWEHDEDDCECVDVYEASAKYSIKPNPSRKFLYTKEW